MRKSEKKGPNSKSPRCPIFKFFVVAREGIFPKMTPILDPVNFFGVFSLISHCVPFYVGVQGAEQVQYATNKVAGRNLILGL